MEIVEELDLYIKTVEIHMSKVLLKTREELSKGKYNLMLFLNLVGFFNKLIKSWSPARSHKSPS